VIQSIFFIICLFGEKLSFYGKLGLQQEQMFGELYIEKHAGDPAA